MNKSQTTKFIFALLFFVVSITALKYYLEFNSAKVNSGTIESYLLSKKINKGGRGDSYDMIIKYKNIKHTISITEKEFYMIENDIYPDLYYAPKSGKVFSLWTIKLTFRVFLLFLLLAVLAVFPWRKFGVFF